MEATKNAAGEVLVSGHVTRTCISGGNGYVFLTTAKGQSVYVDLRLTEAFQKERGQKPHITRKTWVQCWAQPGTKGRLRATYVKGVKLPRRVRRKLTLTRKREALAEDDSSTRAFMLII